MKLDVILQSKFTVLKHNFISGSFSINKNYKYMEGWKVIYESDQIIIIDKQCGVAVQGEGDDIMKQYKITYQQELFPITRIDQPVSGLSIFAKSTKAANHYTILLQNSKIYKEYTGIVEGKYPLDKLYIESFLVKKGNKAYEEKVNGKVCRLNVHKIQHLDRFSILKITIDTGRFHQIRAQLGSIGYPIKGDLKYGSKRSNKEGGIYLHCGLIKLNMDNEEMIFTSPYPQNKNLYQLSTLEQ
jgi:23S rRNA pseudouridine1911/1915/1917 synthase